MGQRFQYGSADCRHELLTVLCIATHFYCVFNNEGSLFYYDLYMNEERVEVTSHVPVPKRLLTENRVPALRPGNVLFPPKP